MNLCDVDSRPVFHQILNRYTTELILNYFHHQWLAIGEKEQDIETRLENRREGAQRWRV